MAILRKLSTWLRPQSPSDADAPIAAAMADLRVAAVRLGLASHADGVRQERERIAAILALPLAGRLPERALALALVDAVTVEQAGEILSAEVERDALLAQLQIAESPAFEDSRAPTFH
jgi:hypothetical protein